MFVGQYFKDLTPGDKGKYLPPFLNVGDHVRSPQDEDHPCPLLRLVWSGVDLPGPYRPYRLTTCTHCSHYHTKKIKSSQRWLNLWIHNGLWVYHIHDRPQWSIFSEEKEKLLSCAQMLKVYQPIWLHKAKHMWRRLTLSLQSFFLLCIFIIILLQKAFGQRPVSTNDPGPWMGSGGMGNVRSTRAHSSYLVTPSKIGLPDISIKKGFIGGVSTLQVSPWKHSPLTQEGTC